MVLAAAAMALPLKAMALFIDLFWALSAEGRSLFSGYANVQAVARLKKEKLSSKQQATRSPKLLRLGIKDL